MLFGGLILSLCFILIVIVSKIESCTRGVPLESILRLHRDQLRMMTRNSSHSHSTPNVDDPIIDVLKRDSDSVSLEETILFPINTTEVTENRRLDEEDSLDTTAMQIESYEMSHFTHSIVEDRASVENNEHDSWVVIVYDANLEDHVNFMNPYLANESSSVIVTL